MTRRNRHTLRQYFADGQRPSGQDFGDLIDSMLNLSDEAFSRSVEHGIEVGASAGHDGLLSLRRSAHPEASRWQVRLGREDDALQILPGPERGTAHRPGAAPTLHLGREGRVGIGMKRPAHTLDVAGVVGAPGRCGTWAGVPVGSLMADGQWHDLSGELGGCQAFEVIAGVGKPGSGRYALTHAVAMNTFHPAAPWWNPFARRRTIRAGHAHYERRSDRLQLCWEGSHGKDARYRLRIRSRSDYGPGVLIQVQLTQLWFDAAMSGGQPR